jgi:hypothetical protein
LVVSVVVTLENHEELYRLRAEDAAPRHQMPLRITISLRKPEHVEFT